MSAGRIFWGLVLLVCVLFADLVSHDYWPTALLLLLAIWQELSDIADVFKGAKVTRKGSS